MALDLTNKVLQRYDKTIKEIDDLILAGPMTPQQRYDYKKALRRSGGKPPQRQSASWRQMQKELRIEELWVLKGIRDALTELQESIADKEFRGESPTLTNLELEEILGDVSSAIEQLTASHKQA